MDVIDVPDIASPAFFADRYPTYRALRDNFPFFRTEIDGEPCIVLTRYADVDEGLRNPLITVQPEPGRFPERVGHGPASRHYRESLPSMDPPDHTRIRRLVTRAFTPQAVAKMRGWIEEVIEQHLAMLKHESEIDFITAFASPVSTEIASRLLHVPVADGEDLFRTSHALLAVLGVSSMADGALDAADAAARVYQAYMQDVLETMKGKQLPEDDFLAVLLAAEDAEKGMTRSESVTTMAGFIIASYHTTKIMMTNAVLALLRHPSQKARLIEQPSFASSAWEEALRYDGAVHFMHRYASRQITIGGASIDPGCRLLLGLQAANRDERRFPDPDRFIIDRPRNRHFGFAGGPHFCMGAPLARLEGEILLQRLFQYFPRMRLNGDPPAPAGDISFPVLMRLDLALR